MARGSRGYRGPRSGGSRFSGCSCLGVGSRGQPRGFSRTGDPGRFARRLDVECMQVCLGVGSVTGAARGAVRGGSRGDCRLQVGSALVGPSGTTRSLGAQRTACCPTAMFELAVGDGASFARRGSRDPRAAPRSASAGHAPPASFPAGAVYAFAGLGASSPLPRTAWQRQARTAHDSLPPPRWAAPRAVFRRSSAGRRVAARQAAQSSISHRRRSTRSDRAQAASTLFWITWATAASMTSRG